VNTCPMDVFRRDFDQPEVPPCSLECPAHIDIRKTMELIRLDRVDEAIDLIAQANPLPAITGYVCYHTCENRCARGDVDEAVSINAVERFLGELMLRRGALPARRLYGARIAIVGSGPAGLSAAALLARRGYPVTVFECEDAPGGLLRKAIPESRLPKAVLEQQIAYIAAGGVSFETGKRLGRDFDLESLKTQGFDAVLLAIGAAVNEETYVESADPLTAQTPLPGVFCVGMADPEPGTVVAAIARGKEAAESIDRFVRGLDIRAGRGEPMLRVKRLAKAGAPPMPRREAEASASGIGREGAEYEAARCMGCGSKSTVKYLEDCQCCAACEWDCPAGAIYVSPEKYQELMVSYK